MPACAARSAGAVRSREPCVRHRARHSAARQRVWRCDPSRVARRRRARFVRRARCRGPARAPRPARARGDAPMATRAASRSVRTPPAGAARVAPLAQAELRKRAACSPLPAVSPAAGLETYELAAHRELVARVAVDGDHRARDRRWDLDARLVGHHIGERSDPRRRRRPAGHATPRVRPRRCLRRCPAPSPHGFPSQVSRRAAPREACAPLAGGERK